MNRFFDELGKRFAAVAAERGDPIEAPTLDPAVAEQLLELARVTAHTAERRFAPLASYMAGVTAERLRGSGSKDASDPAAVASLIERVWTQLEANAPAREDGA